MILHLIADPREIPSECRDRILMPTSIAALQELRKNRVPHVTGSRFLDAADYHAVWESAHRSVAPFSASGPVGRIS